MNDLIANPNASNATIGDIISTIQRKHPRDYLRNTVFSLGGLWAPNSTIGDWLASVPTSPIVISGDRQPFPVLFRDQERLQAFKQAMMAEDTKQHLKRKRSIVGEFHTPHLPIKQELLRVLDEEISLLVPRASVSEALDEIISSDPAMRKSAFHQSCPQHNNQQPFNITCVAVGRFCSTIEHGFRDCTQNECWEGATTNFCLKLYKTDRCTGTFQILKSYSTLSKTIRTTRSFSIC